VGARRGQPTPRDRNTILVAAVLIGGLAIAGLTFVLTNSLNASPTPGPTAGVPTSGAGGPGPSGCPTSQPEALPAGETRTVTIATELGDVVIKVDGSLSPIAAGNFVALAECGYYDGVVFHRTATLQDGTPFVIQGGDPDGTGRGGPGYTIQDEPVTATYRRGTVAMARTSQPNSQGSQFFIVLDDRAVTPLVAANTYAIFGEVVSGMEVADGIYEASNGAELPSDPIAMTRVTVSNP
jgi:cyclophilin family peptidyl-prolyl cis-trans isomerase